MKLRATTPFKPAFDVLIRQFEASSGHRVLIEYGAAPAIETALKSGAACDVVIAPTPQVLSLAKEGLVKDPATYAQAYLAVGVRDGSYLTCRRKLLSAAL